MIVSVSEQGKMFLICLMLGVVFAWLFDVFRALRRSFWTGKYWLFVIDGLYWLIVTVSVLWLLYNINGAEIRMFMAVAFFMGAAGYLKCFSRRMLRLLVPPIRFCYTILKKSLEVCLFPLRLILRLGRMSLVFCWHPLHKFSRILRRMAARRIFFQKRQNKIKKKMKKMQKKL